MATEIEKMEVNIKEEVIYADVPEIYGTIVTESYLTADDAITITAAEVDCQEIVVGGEDVFSCQKIETGDDDSYYENSYNHDHDSNYNPNNNSFKIYSNSESSPLKNNTMENMDEGYANSSNIQKRSYQQIYSETHRHHSLKSKQLELMRVKRLGGKQRLVSVKSDNDEWYPDEKQGTSYSEDMHMVDDDNDVDYEVGKKIRYSSKMGYANFIRTTKPRKRDFAHRLQWRDKDMKEAMKSVDEKHMTIRGAAKKYNVPYSTLKDRVRGRVRHGTKPGVKTVLSPEEEEELVRFVQQMEECGFSLLCIDIRERASELLNLNQRCNSPYRDFIPGHNWLAGFLRRHPGLEIKRASNRIVPPSSSKLKVLLKRFFEVSLHAYRKIWGDDRPTRIYTMVIVQLPSIPKATIIVTAAADGTLLEPYVIGPFNRSVLFQMQQTYPEAHFVTSTDLVSRDKSLLSWFRDYFVHKVMAVTHRKAQVLFLNQPIRNISIRLVEMSLDLGIHLVGMPTNLTSVLQPLNGSFVNELENLTRKQIKWVIVHGAGGDNEVTDRGEVDGGGTNLNGVQIAQVLKRVFDNSELLSDEIRKNFRDCGLYPLSIRAVSTEKLNALSNGNNSFFEEDNNNIGGGGGGGYYDRNGCFISSDFNLGQVIWDSLSGKSGSSFKNGTCVGTKSSGVYGGGGGVGERIGLGQERREEDHGLHLLSELSTAVCTPPSNTSNRHASPPISRHPSVNRGRLIGDTGRKYGGAHSNNTSNGNQRQPSPPQQQQQRSQQHQRIKRSAAGASERLMKRILGREIKNNPRDNQDGNHGNDDDDDEEDDEYGTEDGSDNGDDGDDDDYQADEDGGDVGNWVAANKRLKLNHHHQHNDDGDEEEEEDNVGVDDDDEDDGGGGGGCSRTRPADDKYRLRRFNTLSQEEVDMIGCYDDAHSNHHHDDSNNYRYRNHHGYNHHDSAVQYKRHQPQHHPHPRHFVVAAGRSKNHTPRQHPRDNLTRGGLLLGNPSSHDSDIITQAVESILPSSTPQQQQHLNDNNNISNFIKVDGKLFENLNPLTSIRIPLSSTTLPKTPKLQYSLKKPLNHQQRQEFGKNIKEEMADPANILTEEIPIHIHDMICNQVETYPEAIVGSSEMYDGVDNEGSITTTDRSNDNVYRANLHIVLHPNDNSAEIGGGPLADQSGVSRSNEQSGDLNNFKGIGEHLLSDIIGNANNEITKVVLNEDYNDDDRSGGGGGSDVEGGGDVAQLSNIQHVEKEGEHPSTVENPTTSTSLSTSSTLILTSTTSSLSSSSSSLLPTSKKTTMLQNSSSFKSPTNTTTTLPPPAKTTATSSTTKTPQKSTKTPQKATTVPPTTTTVPTTTTTVPTTTTTVPTTTTAPPTTTIPSTTTPAATQIQIGDETYDLDKKVKMTKCINIGGQLVQIIRVVSLKEALDNSNVGDPDLIDCSLELIDS